MPFYKRLGSVPPKRHTQFRSADGSLYHEEVMGLRGFSGIQSILYHLYAPTEVSSVQQLAHVPYDLAPPSDPLSHHHLAAQDFQSTGDPIVSRVPLLVNTEVALGLATPTEPMSYFYRNALADELLFIHFGGGTLHSQFGRLPFGPGDYIVIPVGTTYRIELTAETRMLFLETNSRIEIPRRYRNEYGQLLEHSPYCERDFRVPESLDTIDERGQFEIRVKTGDRLTRIVMEHHPFDVVGWDGFLYPWIFNIRDFEPITGRIHQPPPVHQTFQGEGFVVCSFVPRMFDYHPLAIPVPYNHSNVNSDEVLYYVEGNFMSRKGIAVGSFTHHPCGIPHGPHPGAVEGSLGAKATEELAVMVDTFRPLNLTTAGQKLVDPGYMRSWLSAPN